MMGLPDGAYEWTNGDTVSSITKVGAALLLEGTDTIAGRLVSAITLGIRGVLTLNSARSR